MEDEKMSPVFTVSLRKTPVFMIWYNLLFMELENIL